MITPKVQTEPRCAVNPVFFLRSWHLVSTRIYLKKKALLWMPGREQRSFWGSVVEGAWVNNTFYSNSWFVVFFSFVPLLLRLYYVYSSSMTGSYSSTPTGIPHVHESIAKFIEMRDGKSSDPENIIISSGLETTLWVWCLDNNPCSKQMSEISESVTMMQLTALVWKL